MLDPSKSKSTSNATTAVVVFSNQQPYPSYFTLCCFYPRDGHSRVSLTIFVFTATHTAFANTPDSELVLDLFVFLQVGWDIKAVKR